MNKTIKIIIGLVLIALAGGWIYWQYNKKRIVRNAIEDVVTGKSDSLYYIHYDSSAIDAVNGNASFYNVSLQSDSLETQLRNYDTAAAKTIFNVSVQEVNIRGANVPAILSNDKVEASQIRIVKPVIYVIGSANQKKEKFSYRDTLAIYEKLLGKFNSIKANEIIIEGGELYLTEKIDTPFVSLQGINIQINNFLIDSTKNYDNIVSYFVKDASVVLKKAIVKQQDKGKTILLSDISYNAAAQGFRVGNFQLTDAEGKVNYNITNTRLTGLSTDLFIINKQLKADSLSTDGGLLTFYQKKGANNGSQSIEFDYQYFDEAVLNNIDLRNLELRIYNKEKMSDPPLALNKVHFSANGIQKAYSGTDVKNLIGKSNWNLSAAGFSQLTANKIYKLEVGPFSINTAAGTIQVDFFNVKPQLSEEQFNKGLKEQTDLYNVSVKGIQLTGVDTRKLITDKILLAEAGTISPTIKVSCDRTLPPFTGSKVGNYPHQLIQKLKFPIHIKKLDAKNAYISYTERSAQSGMKGTVFFSAANGSIENITNIKERIAQNNLLILNARAKLMGKANLQTHWELPLNTSNGAFKISGSGGSFDARVLNPLIEPLALASIDKGRINKLDFAMTGDDLKSNGSATLLYEDLKIEALKKDSNDLKKKKLISFIANVVIKDSNPKNGDTRKADTDVERDKTRSFFNLVWKGIFKSAKRIALGKDDG